MITTTPMRRWWGLGDMAATGRHVVSSLFGGHDHDAADSMDDALESSARGIRAVWVSFAVLMVTAVAQLVVVWVSGSVALLADTVHNFSDALTAVPLLLAFRLGRRHPDPSHTYGYRRAEDLAGLVIVIMIAASAVLAGRESIDRLLDPRPIRNVGVVFAAGLIGFVGNEAVASYRVRVGRAIGSAALQADGAHARVDGLTSLAVSLGAIGVWLGFDWADPAFGLVVTVAILGVLVPTTRRVLQRLMDAVDPALVQHVQTIAAGVDGVLAVGRCQVRWLGHRLRADLDIVVDADLTVAAGHDIAEGARRALTGRVRHLDDVHVHVDGHAPDPRPGDGRSRTSLTPGT